MNTPEDRFEEFTKEPTPADGGFLKNPLDKDIRYPLALLMVHHDILNLDRAIDRLGHEEVWVDQYPRYLVSSLADIRDSLQKMIYQITGFENYVKKEESGDDED